MGEPNGSSARLADELAVQRVMAEYCRRVDDGQFASVAELFVAGGVFEYGSARHCGRDALVAFLEITQVPERRGRHSCGYSIVEFDSLGGAEAVTDFVFLGRAEGSWIVKLVGRYHDTLRREHEGWRFVERRVVIVDVAV